MSFKIDPPLVESTISALAEDILRSGTETDPEAKKRLDSFYDKVVHFESIGGMLAHQYLPLAHLRLQPKKNLAIIYSPGLGKTLPAAWYAIHSPAKKAIYMAPSSLIPQFKQQLAYLGETSGERYGYVTSSASNVYKQWRNAIGDLLDYANPGEPLNGRPPYEATLVKERDELGEPIGKSPTVLLVMDEAHLFSARVASILSAINYSVREEKKLEGELKEAYLLYREVCRDNRIQLLALSGTPIQNHPFNSVPLCNMLRREFVGGDGRKGQAFTEMYEKYYNEFVKGVTMLDNPETAKEIEGVMIQREELFAMRMRSLILWFEPPKGLKGLPIPVILRNEIVRVPMSEYQWKAYRKMEEEEERIMASIRTRREESREGIPRVDDISVYKSFTRQVSNFAFPLNLYDELGVDPVTGKVKKRKSAEEMLATLSEGDFDLEKIAQSSCKMYAIMKDVLSRKDRIHSIYSHYVKGAGLSPLVRILKHLGWISLNEAAAEGVETFEQLEERIKGKASGTEAFVVLSGDESSEEKTHLLKIFNHPKNSVSKTIRMVLYSGAASHGLTFKSGRVIHILEPQWDEVEIEQAIDRWVRIGSASRLPPEERSVEVLQYAAVPPAKMEAQTTDLYLFSVIEYKLRLRRRIIQWFKSCALNCRGVYEAENRRDKALIGATPTPEVPPTRTFFSCITCAAAYQPSYHIQSVSSGECVRTTYPPRDSISVDGGKYTLDRNTGLGWERSEELGIDRLIVNSDELQLLWRRALGQSISSPPSVSPSKPSGEKETEPKVGPEAGPKAEKETKAQ